jgi:hypothetical protein
LSFEKSSIRENPFYQWFVGSAKSMSSVFRWIRPIRVIRGFVIREICGPKQKAPPVLLPAGLGESFRIVERLAHSPPPARRSGMMMMPVVVAQRHYEREPSPLCMHVSNKGHLLGNRTCAKCEVQLATAAGCSAFGFHERTANAEIELSLTR